MAPYSRVTIYFAPASISQASTHGDVEPITYARAFIFPGVCLRASRNSFVSFAPNDPPSFPSLANCIRMSTFFTVHTGIDFVRPRYMSLKYTLINCIRPPLVYSSFSYGGIALGALAFPCPNSI